MAATSGLSTPVRLAPAPAEPAAAEPRSTSAPGYGLERTGCPAHSIPDRGGCLRLPDRPGLASARGRPPALALTSARRLRLATGAQAIARLPGRPERYADYRLPVEPVWSVLSADLDAQGGDVGLAPGWAGRPSAAAVRVETEGGAAVRAIELEGQQGATVAVAVGELYGVTVVTRHRVASAAGLRSYLLIHGGLDRPGPGIVSGATLAAGATLGFCNPADEATDGDGLASLDLELRQLRPDAPKSFAHLSEMLSPAVSVPCDLRNALPSLDVPP